MTVVPNTRADRFVARPPAEIGFFLVHGSDEGLVNERAKAILAATNPGPSDGLHLIRLDGDDIARQPGLLLDEAYALSLFGERRSIWIDAHARDFSAALEPLFAKPPEDCAIIVKAGALKKGASLRSRFEAADNAASIECYPDSHEALEALVDREVRASGMAMSADAREMLLELLGADRQTTRNEIAKLLLYCHGGAEIGADDVAEILGDQAISTVDDTLDIALLGELSSLVVGASRIPQSDGDNEFLLPRLAMRLITLYRLRIEMEQGASFDSAQRSVGVRLPMAAANALRRQAKQWTSGGLARQLQALRTVSARARADSALSHVVTVRALWSLVRQAKRAR